MKEMAAEGSAEKPRTDYDRHLKSAQLGATDIRFDADKEGPPKFGGTVERARGGKRRSTQIVAQAGFDLEGEPTVEFQTNTGGRLKGLTPMEEEVRLASEGRNIDPATAQRAARQRLAIERSYARRKPR